jgi:hypothetical protein
MGYGEHVVNNYFALLYDIPTELCALPRIYRNPAASCWPKSSALLNNQHREVAHRCLQYKLHEYLQHESLDLRVALMQQLVLLKSFLPSVPIIPRPLKHAGPRAAPDLPGRVLNVFVVSAAVTGIVEGPASKDEHSAEILSSDEALSDDTLVAVDVLLEALNVLVSDRVLHSLGGGPAAGVGICFGPARLRRLEGVDAPQAHTLPVDLQRVTIYDAGGALYRGLGDGEGGAGTNKDGGG